MTTLGRVLFWLAAVVVSPVLVALACWHVWRRRRLEREYLQMSKQWRRAQQREDR